MDGQAKRTVERGMAGAGLLAGPLCALAMVVSAARLPGFRQALHPPALLGAAGLPGAAAWNLLGFVLPGVLVLLGLQAFDRALRRAGAGLVARIGATLLSLSALAFAAQGLLPLDLHQAIDAGPGRWHVAAWTAWWLSACAGWLVLAPGVAPLPRWRGLLPASIAAAIAMLLLLHADIVPLATGWRQRLALAVWFGWAAWASWRVLRVSRSAA